MRSSDESAEAGLQSTFKGIDGEGINAGRVGPYFAVRRRRSGYAGSTTADASLTACSMAFTTVECDVRSCLQGVYHATCLPLLERPRTNDSQGAIQELGIHALRKSRAGRLMVFYWWDRQM